MNDKMSPESEPGNALMDSARRMLNVVQAAYPECDHATLSMALATAAGMALARFHWPNMARDVDFHTIGGCMGNGFRQGFEDKTRAEVSSCRGAA
ncbi:MAG: hypothetical protein KGH75_11910 [Rhodospirillales bacterium]|nr:hypothetical protein [Rhodospirillales bacterium]